MNLQYGTPVRIRSFDEMRELYSPGYEGYIETPDSLQWSRQADVAELYNAIGYVDHVECRTFLEIQYNIVKFIDNTLFLDDNPVSLEDHIITVYWLDALQKQPAFCESEYFSLLSGGDFYAL